MIIVQIDAGMGNQMFKYAAGLSTAKRLGVELFLSTTWFRSTKLDIMNRSDRPYCLDCFPAITEKEATFQNTLHSSFWLATQVYLFRAGIKRRNIFKRLLRKSISVFGLTRVFYQDRQKEQGYVSKFEKILDNSWLNGVFESEKYFKDVAPLVRKKFTFAPECFNQKLLAQVQNCNSVAFHIRRGDKVVLNSYIPTTEDFIKLAVEKIYDLTTEPEFFIFSDDLEWCKKILPSIKNIDWHFVEGQTPPQDMALMTKCKHVIIGPSTFSWWGAWLNENPNKIIIAPKLSRWGNNNTDKIPDEWIKL